MPLLIQVYWDIEILLVSHGEIKQQPQEFDIDNYIFIMVLNIDLFLSLQFFLFDFLETFISIIRTHHKK